MTISAEELEFYIQNHARLAELDRALSVTYGQITGALESQQSSSPRQHSLHHTTMKWILQDNWLLKVLDNLKAVMPEDSASSPRMMILKSLVNETMQYLETPRTEKNSIYNVKNSDELRKRLETISTALGDIRLRAVEKLIEVSLEAVKEK